MPSYRPRDAVVDTSSSIVLFGAKRNRSFEYEMDPASSMISPRRSSITSKSSSGGGGAMVVYDPSMPLYIDNQIIEPMTKATPAYQRMKKQRKRKTAVAGASGAIFGGIVAGPAGAICIGAGAAVATRKICKVQQKRMMRKSERISFQAAALDGRRAVHSATFV